LLRPVEIIKTKDLVLRPLSQSDEPEFIRIHELSQADFSEWMPASFSDKNLSEQFSEELIRCKEGLSQGTAVRLSAFLPNGRMAGVFALSQIFHGDFQNAFASWRVSSDLVGQGLATQGVQALLVHAFNKEEGVGLHRVQANIIPSNTASLRVAEKTGFRHEGLAKKYLKINSQWQDHIMLAKTCDED